MLQKTIAKQSFFVKKQNTKEPLLAEEMRDISSTDTKPTTPVSRGIPHPDTGIS